MIKARFEHQSNTSSVKFRNQRLGIKRDGDSGFGDSLASCAGKCLNLQGLIHLQTAGGNRGSWWCWYIYHILYLRACPQFVYVHLLLCRLHPGTGKLGRLWPLPPQRHRLGAFGVGWSSAQIPWHNATGQLCDLI